MKTAIIYGPEDIRVEEVSVPVIGPDDVLVKVRASGICGSDVHRYLGTAYGRNCWRYPMNSGHEYCGDVVQVGDQVKRFREGAKVTLGVAWTSGPLGAFSEFVAIPNADSRLCELPARMPYATGALMEIFLVALKSSGRPSPTPDSSILILGAGPIGLCVLLLCKARGMRDITVSEPSSRRRALAERIGATVVDPDAGDLEETVMSSTDGKGADVAFECAGDEATLNEAFALTRSNGKISLIGHYRKTPRFNIEDLIVRSMSVFAPADEGPFIGEAVELASAEKVDLAQLVTHEYPLEKAKEAFEVASDPNQSVKVLFTPG